MVAPSRTGFRFQCSPRRCVGVRRVLHRYPVGHESKRRIPQKISVPLCLVDAVIGHIIVRRRRPPTDAKSVPSPPTPRRAGHVDTQDATFEAAYMTTKQRNSSGNRADIEPLSQLGEWQRRRLSSRVLHRAGAVLEEPGAGVTVAACIVAWTITGAATGFPQWWQIVLYSVGSTVTLIMVFVIQHTQARQISSMQRKLDELLRSSSANNQLIAVEEAPDQLLQRLGESNLADRLHALQDNTGLPDGAPSD